MIPKIIHYCWFGHGKLPRAAVKCIESWKKYLPDYEIKEWNESNFDVYAIPYTRDAYAAKKYAFVSDYARFWILYKHGGLYFDTDVEVIKDLSGVVSSGPFMGCEQRDDHVLKNGMCYVAPGLGLGAEPGMPLYKRILDIYEHKTFKCDPTDINQETVVTVISNLLKESGLQTNPDKPIQCNGVMIYPEDYFCPMSGLTRKITLTRNTCTIHHFSASWMNRKARVKHEIKFALSRIGLDGVVKLYHRLKARWLKRVG